MNVRALQIACLLSGCFGFLLTGCGSGEPDPSLELRAFVADSFGKAMADSRLRAEFDLEPPQFLLKQDGEASPKIEATIQGVDRAIKGLDVADWVIEKRDRIKGGGRGRIKLARDSGDDGTRSFVFVYVLKDGRWTLQEHKCAGRGFIPDELKRYFELPTPAPAPVAQR